MESRVKDIKRAQKEKLLLREISLLFHQAQLENKVLQDLFISRVELSPSKSMCDVYFYSVQGIDDFKEKLELLKLYKPSIRASIAKTIQARYTPNIVFKFDTQYEKQTKINQLIHTISEELKKSDSSE